MALKDRTDKPAPLSRKASATYQPMALRSAGAQNRVRNGAKPAFFEQRLQNWEDSLDKWYSPRELFYTGELEQGAEVPVFGAGWWIAGLCVMGLIAWAAS